MRPPTGIWRPQLFRVPRLRAPSGVSTGAAPPFWEDYPYRPLTRQEGLLLESVWHQRLGRLSTSSEPLPGDPYEFHRETIDLSDLVRRLVHQRLSDDPGRNVEVIIENGLTTQGDRHLLEIALSNLLDNAWKFTKKTDRPRIEFSANLWDGQPCFVSGTLVWDSTDHGNQFFTPFGRLHREDEFPGTGIGPGHGSTDRPAPGGEIRRKVPWERGIVLYETAKPRKKRRKVS